MEYATEKWGGIPHYRGEVRRLGDDAFGEWWWGARGRTIWRGDEALFVTNEDVLFLLPPGAWWSATWWLGHPECVLYLNVQTPVEVEPDRLVSIDLDLDVALFTDGRVEVVDRDEWEEHQVRFGYPPDVIATTEEVTADLYDRLLRREAPFDGVAAQAWAARGRAEAV